MVMALTLVPLSLDGLALVRGPAFSDERGTFVETFREATFAELGLPRFVQDNESLSLRRGTLRGMHFQNEPHGQAKLVRVLSGEIFDVAVDLRPDSPTFGKWEGVTLSAFSGEQLFVPRGFAHGFCTLSDTAAVAYRCDGYYAREAEGAVHFADPDLAIEWPIPPADMILSEKDAQAGSFAAFAAAAGAR